MRPGSLELWFILFWVKLNARGSGWGRQRAEHVGGKHASDFRHNTWGEHIGLCLQHLNQLGQGSALYLLGL